MPFWRFSWCFVFQDQSEIRLPWALSLKVSVIEEQAFFGGGCIRFAILKRFLLALVALYQLLVCKSKNQNQDYVICTVLADLGIITNVWALELTFKGNCVSSRVFDYLSQENNTLSLQIFISARCWSKIEFNYRGQLPFACSCSKRICCLFGFTAIGNSSPRGC